MPKGTIEPGDGNGPGVDRTARSTIKCKEIKLIDSRGREWVVPEANIPILARYDADNKKEKEGFEKDDTAREIEVSFDLFHFKFGDVDYLGAINVVVL
ncbi:MAG: hypothetical protein KDD32_00615 [Bacteroidetes bacterium]|nr:hypothetical protein [Bacteroidota bacterium]